MSNRIIAPRENVSRLTAYDPGNYQVKINLSANENPYDVPAEIKAEILAAAQGINFNRYPDPMALGLRTALAESFGVGVDNVAVGNGGDELLLALLLAYGGDGRTVVTFEPTFVMYGILAGLTGTGCARQPRRADFDLPDDAAGLVKTAGGQIVFVCSPNNPTGNPTTADRIVPLLETGALVVVDEAYAEFSRASVSGLLGAYPNLAVLRTFSKALALAGLRIGYLLAHEEVVGNILKVKLPYNVNVFTQAAATILARRREALAGIIEEIIAERERVFAGLSEIDGVDPYPSASNFILVQVRSGPALWRNLLERGILVRDFTRTPALKDCLRVTVGTPAENDALIAAVRERAAG